MGNLWDNDKSRPTEVEHVRVGDDEAGQRLDNFLLSRLKGIPRTRIYRLVRKGEVRVNKGRSSASYRLCPGDLIRIPPVRRSAPVSGPTIGPGARGFLESRVLFEDERLIVLDKPSGMAVHGGSGLSFGVIEALRAARPEASYLELVHRLDKDTSGCLMVAKRRSYLRSLHALLRTGRVEKRYLALVKGHWDLGTRMLEDTLKTHHREGGERHVKLDDSGKIAASRFSPVQLSSLASLVEVELHTGRTHQIRVQATGAGHPLAGDDKYGDREFNRRVRALGLKRMFLHAHSVAYEDPTSGDWRSFSCPLPDDLRTVLEQLERARG
jgi:23S rRNA pseudouridine955/2504/2580 synthase